MSCFQRPVIEMNVILFLQMKGFLSLFLIPGFISIKVHLFFAVFIKKMSEGADRYM